MGYTYPPTEGASFNGDVVTVNQFLNDQPSVAKRVATLASQQFISDVLLSQRYTTTNGSLTIETARAFGTKDSARIVTPLGDYPLTTVGSGTASSVSVSKWGHDSEISDESISRMKLNPVEGALTGLVEQITTDFDKATLSAIYSAVTKEIAGAAIATATLEELLVTFGKAKAYIEQLGLGFTPNLVVLDPMLHALLTARLAAQGALPEPTRAGLLTGSAFPQIAGMTYLPSRHAVSGRALVLDSANLGGILSEALQSPGYSRATGVEGAAPDIETKVMRLDERDGFRVRARRVAAPVILEPSAAVELTGLGTVTV